MIGWNTARTFAACVAVIVALLAVPAWAQPWIPPANSGTVKATVSFTDANSSFSPSSFGTATTPSSTRTQDRQLRANIVYGLGDGWAFNYDLRGDNLSKTKRGRTRSTTGLQNQYIGLSHALRQRPAFADAVSLSLITPTLTRTRRDDPKLGIDPFAFEALYTVGVKGRLGSHGVFANFAIGPWIYPRDGVVQLRSSLAAGIGVVPRVTLIGTVFFPRTIVGRRPSAVSNPTNAEFYDLLLGGVELEYALTPTVRLITGYQRKFAGQSISADNRVILGASWRF